MFVGKKYFFFLNFNTDNFHSPSDAEFNTVSENIMFIFLQYKLSLKTQNQVAKKSLSSIIIIMIYSHSKGTERFFRMNFYRIIYNEIKLHLKNNCLFISILGYNYLFLNKSSLSLFNLLCSVFSYKIKNLKDLRASVHFDRFALFQFFCLDGKLFVTLQFLNKNFFKHKLPLFS
jgi:hypothetical protein